MTSNSSSAGKQSETRRSFIKKTATAAAAVSAVNIFKTPVYGQNQAPSPGKVIGANDRINVAYVGVGKQGTVHVVLEKEHAQDNNIAQVAMCDLYDKHLHDALEKVGLPASAGYTDHRKLLENKDIDAIIAAPTDVWHAQVTMDALEAGKHVYCEKPMSRYLPEAQQVYETVKRTGKTYVIGSQGCMDPKWHQAAKWIKEGKLGPLVWGQGSYCRNNKNNSEWTFQPDRDFSEKSVDWVRWQGKAAKVPFDPARYFSWHKYYAYNSGIIGNLLPHRFQPMMLATGNPEFPRRVVCTGTRMVSTDREITDTTHLLAEFPSGLTLVVAGSTVNEQGLPDMLRGRKGTLHFASSQNRVELKPETIFVDEIEPLEFSDAKPTESIESLEKHFFDCIRSGKTPIPNVELAIRAQTVLCLAEMSERLGLALFYNPDTRVITTGDGKVVPALTYDTVVPKLG